MDNKISRKLIGYLTTNFGSASTRTGREDLMERFWQWLEPYAVPVETIPAAIREGPVWGKSVDGWIYFFQWFNPGDGFIYGAPIWPNAGESDVPEDPNVGYRIPAEAFKTMPKRIS